MGLGVAEAGRRTTGATREMMQQVARPGMAAHIGREELAESVIPTGPIGAIEIAGHVPAETPGFGDENLVRRARAEVGLDFAQQRRAQQFGEVQADAIDPEHFGPVRQRFPDETLEQGSLRPDIVPTPAPVREPSLRVGPEIVFPIQRHQAVGGTEMIQHHIKNHRETRLMAGTHDILKFRQGDRPGAEA